MKALPILKRYQQCGVMPKNRVIDVAIKELEELQNRSCNRCKDKYSCYIYKTLDEKVTFLVSCESFEPKE